MSVIKAGRRALRGRARVVTAVVLAAGALPTFALGVPAVGNTGSDGASARSAADGSTAAAVQAASIVTVELCAKAGTATMPGPRSVDIWGFADKPAGVACSDASVDAGIPGPRLTVTAGDEVTVVLHNEIPGQDVAMLFPGQDLIPDPAGAATGESVSYTFTADAPGTYIYEAAGHRQALMGLYGALVVMPTAAGQAYDGAATAFDSQADLVLSEIDPAFHADPTGFNLVNYAPKYWLINGKAHPQTDPIDVQAGKRLLLRYVNAGGLNHTMTTLSLHQQVIAKDADPLSYPFSAVAETIPAGATLDTIVTTPNGAAVGTKFPLYNRQLHLSNDGSFPGGMLTFIHVATAGEPPVNQPPSVSAGSDQTVTQLSASLNGTATDDGLLQPLTLTWSKVSGPGTVTFGNANTEDTTATFSEAGTYTLQLEAYDGQYTVSDQVEITVDLSMHIGDLDGTSLNIAGNRWRAQVTVTVHNLTHAAVSGASVTGTWSAGDTNGRSLSCTTNATGACGVQSGRLSRATNASVTFTVTGVTKSGSTYQSSANHDPDGSSTGTAITVARP